MRGHSTLLRPARGLRLRPAAAFVCRQCRTIQISAAPSTDSPRAGDAFGAPIENARDMAGTDSPASLNTTRTVANLYLADARFEVLGSPYSMLSVTLSASQKLYTRRGTLIAVAGQPENVRNMHIDLSHTDILGTIDAVPP